MDSDNIQNDDDLGRLAKKRVGIKMGFYTHLLVFVLVNGGFYLLRGLANGFDGFGGSDGSGGMGRHHWPFFPMWGWALGLTIHGIVTFVSLQGMGIKDRMLAAEIEALKRRQR